MEESRGLLKVGHVARRLGISIPQVYRLAKSGEIPCIRIGAKSIRFDLMELEMYIRNRRKTA